MGKRKGVLNAALKALLAGAESSAVVKIPATFVSELAADARTLRRKEPQISWRGLWPQPKLSPRRA
jgi:hypothetical protein